MSLDSHVPPLSKAEALKASSAGLRGTLAEELAQDTAKFSNDAEQLLKFHGMYQQKDRDRRRPDERHLGPKPFSLMVRGRIPGGRLTPAQWAAWDDVATRYAADGLRITSRQSLELHGLLKGDTRAALQAINAALSTTTGACGDVVRNVVQAVNPWDAPRLSRLDAPAELLSRHFEVRSRAYAEIFLDGVAHHAPATAEPDPIYGQAYLPRKFKIAVTAAGNNSVDLYTHDLGFAATYDAQDAIDGYVVVAGGGMGMTHGDAATFPRLADELGWIPAAALLAVAAAVVAVQRDHGNRADRAGARLKYTVSARSAAWLRAEVEARAGVRFAPRALPPWQTPPHLGWTTRHDGTLAFGLHVLSGRLRDAPGAALRRVVADLVGRYHLGVQLTPEQDLVLLGIRTEDRAAVAAALAAAGVAAASPGKLYDRAMTCVALPMCSKALAEAERIGPELLAQLHRLLIVHGLAQRAPVVRVTGCPNGCARPYAAEIGLVGQLPGKYAVYLGGHPEGTRLAFRALDTVPFAALAPVLGGLFGWWAGAGAADEGFGDFVTRLPRAELLTALAASLAAAAAPRPRVFGADAASPAPGAAGAGGRS